MLSLDFSVVAVFLLVWLLMAVLTRIFFQPLGAIINQREEKIAGDRQRLERLLEEISAKSRALEGKVQEAQQDALRIRQERSRQGEALREQLVEKARQRAADLLTAKMADLEKEIAQAQRQLECEVAAFSRQLQETLL